MRTPSPVRRSWLIPLAALGLGCSSTGTGGLARSGNDPKIQTIASVGDRPVSTRAGGATSSAVADMDAPGPSRTSNDRVSGRVVDDRGDPVPNARVRVADGGLSGGRVAEATSDRAGGFTLRGLRPGSNYTLIAEYEGQGGWIEGRAEVRIPSTGVEIAVQADELPADRRRAGRSPSGRTVSDRNELDDRRGTSSRVNDDDLPDATDDDQADATPTKKSRQAVMVAGNGWRASRAAKKTSDTSTPSALDDRATLRASTLPTDEGEDPLPRATRRVADDPPADDEENPLPPAIESGGRRSRGGDDPDPEPAATRPRSTRRVSQANPQRPGPTPGALTSAKDDFTTTIERARVARREPDPQPVPVSAAEHIDEPPPAPAAEPAVYDPFPAPKKPTTWEDLSAAWTQDEPPRSLADADTADFEPRPDAAPDQVRRAEALADRPSRATASLKELGPQVEACRYDAKRLQLLDFRLPDLQGRPVTLRDFDADFILLDFWGTWCRPCLSSVPHLVELQKQFKGRSLAVVGVACEPGPASASTAHVADVAKRLGINYTVLVSSKDDAASPVQEALHVSAYPTMILVDRNGRVVWRDQGATTTTLARLDRILATSTKANATARR
jgi:thiol-disulfide isomerase/thioredoxin